MIRQPEQSSIRFRALTDNPFSLKKISSDVANQAKNQYDKLLNFVKYEKNNEFHNFDFKKDRLDAFLAKYLTSDSYKDLWHICKLIFLMSRGQSNIERGFPVNKEVLEDNLQTITLISQQLIYDTLICTDSELHSFAISPAFYKSCKFVFSKYKADLERQREEKIAAEQSLKRKSTEDELQNAKKQKIDLETSIAALSEGLVKETLAAYKTKDMGNLAKDAAFCSDIKEKGEEYDRCCKMITNLERVLSSQ